MAFGAVTILMDTLHQHFLLPEPRFPLRNKTKAKLLYKNLSSLQTSLEQDFKVGEYDEAIMKGLEGQVRDVSVELRFQIEQQLTLFYLGKSMKLRLHSARKLLPILNRAIKDDIQTMDLGSMLDILPKHFTLPVWRMPAHIKKKVKSFCTQHRFLFCRQKFNYEQEPKNEQEVVEQKSLLCERRRNMMHKAKSVITQELRACYLKKYMKQRGQARNRIRQLFCLGIKLTSYINKQLLKVKNACHQSKNSQNNNTASLRGMEGDSLQHTSESTIKMVGCDDEFNTIMDKLNQQSNRREIVSIVGMGGIGKTTLARQIYEDASFISRFDCRAWVTISQEYNPRQVFQSLLHSLALGVFENNDELAKQVYQCLKGRRYVIVIDDLWNTDVWDDLMRCFQDDNNGSRVLLTTRLKNVAEYAASSSHFCHNKQFLGSYQSWNLFCSKVSKRIILSPDFEIIAREIVKKCKGLPLAITVAAGLLLNSNQTSDEWERIAKNVATLSLDHSNQQRENIIDLSYTFLPHHLKLCFLSFGCFPEDYKVDDGMIVDFWVSEGFLKVLGYKSLEDVARGNLQDLVDRNLLLLCCGEKDDKVYQMHDVLRELALREAKKENLIGFNESSAIGLRFKRIQPKNSSSVSQPLSIQSRICSYNGITYTSNTSSLIDLIDLLRYTVMNITRAHAHFKFLRALATCEGIDVHNIFLEIVGLVHLRWLTIHCRLNLHSLPLFMLWNLKKLKINFHSSCEPLDIWGLPQLRNLHVGGVVTLVPPRSIHHNLESICYLDYRSCTKELFLRIPNLRTLKVSASVDTINSKCKAPNWFESLVYLYKLEELMVQRKPLRKGFTTIRSVGMLSLENYFPNLKKLEFVLTELKWKDVDVVGMLPKLEKLELCHGVVGKKWKTRDGGFRRLKLLEISGCDLQCWEATSGAFPVLECLFLRFLDLEEIPSDLADITTLKSIKLDQCSGSAISSAKCIRDEQLEYGNDEFVVHISWSDFKLHLLLIQIYFNFYN